MRSAEGCRAVQGGAGQGVHMPKPKFSIKTEVLGGGGVQWQRQRLRLTTPPPLHFSVDAFLLTVLSGGLLAREVRNNALCGAIRAAKGHHRAPRGPANTVTGWRVDVQCAVRGEQQLIAEFPNNLNDRKSQRKPYMRWLVRIGLHKQLTESALTDHGRWQQYLTAGRITLHPLDALRILVEAKRALPPVKFSPLQTRVLAYWKAHAHVALPRAITLHVPFVTKTERLQLRKACAEFFHDTPYPRALGAYLAAVLGIPLTIPPKMLRVFCKDRLVHSSQHYLQAAQDAERCGCVKDLQATHCEGACLFQKDTLVSQFGPRYQVVLSAQNNYTTIPSRWKLHQKLSSSLNAIREKLPKIRIFPFRRLAARVHDITSAMMHGHANLQRTLPPQNHIKSFHKEHPEWVPVRLDKNTHCFALVCYTFFCQLVVKSLNAGNYRLFHSFPSPTHLYATYLVYFYTLVLCVPVLRKHVAFAHMRTRLSQMSPPLKGYRFSTYQGTPPLRQMIRRRESFKQSVFAHATAEASRAITLSPFQPNTGPPPDATPSKKKKWTVPGVILSLKNKGLTTSQRLRLELAKLREIFTQASHPLRTLLRKGGRCLSLLLRVYTHTFVSLEILDQAHLVQGFLRPAREEYKRLGIPVGGFELDIDRMFPSIIRDQVPSAWQSLSDRYDALNPLRRGESARFVSLAKGNARDMDCLGMKDQRYYDTFSISEIHDLMKVDLFLNSFFQLGHELWEQFSGVAIGGAMSAQNADAYLVSIESLVPWGQFLPTHVKLGRFRDNIFCICPLHEIPIWMAKIKCVLSELYRLDLSVEPAGRSLCFLEVQIDCHHEHIEWGMKNKVLLSHLTDCPPTLRYPSVHEPHASQTVHGIASAVAQKSSELATTVAHRVNNFRHAYWEFSSKNYPKSWWEGILRTAFEKQQPPYVGQPPLHWSMVRDNWTWECPVPPGYAWLHPTSTLPTLDLRTETPSLQAFQRTSAGHHLIPIKTFPLPYTDRTQQVVLQVLPTPEPPRKRQKTISLPTPPQQSTGRITRSRQAPIFLYDMTPQRRQRRGSVRQRQPRTNVTISSPPPTARHTTPSNPRQCAHRKRTRPPSPRSPDRQTQAPLSPPPLKKLRNRLRHEQTPLPVTAPRPTTPPCNLSVTDPETTNSPSSVHSHATSSTDSDVEVPTVPRGPHASPQQVADVQQWWSREIEPYKALILGPHEARLVAAMSPVDQWSYRKYRYDVHFYYKNVAPPPPPQGNVARRHPRHAYTRVTAMASQERTSRDVRRVF